MLTFIEGEHKNEISAGEQFQMKSTIDFLFVNGSKVFLVRIQMPFQNNDFEPSISQYSIAVRISLLCKVGNWETL